jgi:hypothetical protein
MKVMIQIFLPFRDLALKAGPGAVKPESTTWAAVTLAAARDSPAESFELADDPLDPEADAQPATTARAVSAAAARPIRPRRARPGLLFR